MALILFLGTILRGAASATVSFLTFLSFSDFSLPALDQMLIDIEPKTWPYSSSNLSDAFALRRHQRRVCVKKIMPLRPDACIQ